MNCWDSGTVAQIPHGCWIFTAPYRVWQSELHQEFRRVPAWLQDLLPWQRQSQE